MVRQLAEVLVRVDGLLLARLPGRSRSSVHIVIAGVSVLFVNLLGGGRGISNDRLEERTIKT